MKDLIKPDRTVAPHFVSAIIHFLRTEIGEESYSSLKLSDPIKNMNVDNGNVQFSSLMRGKDLTALWNACKSEKLQISNLSPAGSTEITRFKVSLSLSKNFLLKYGNTEVKEFVANFEPEDNSPNSGDENITTVQELIKALVNEKNQRSKARTVSAFFKWFLDQKKIVADEDYTVLPRTAYKFQGNEPEFAIRVLKPEGISKIVEFLKKEGCDVDIAGKENNVVRVKALVEDLSKKISSAAKTKKAAKKKAVKKATVKKASAKKAKPKKSAKQTRSKAKPKTNSRTTTVNIFAEVTSQLSVEVHIRQISEFALKFFTKQNITAKDVETFRKVLTLKRKEIEVLKNIEKSFSDLAKIRKSISEFKI